MEPLSEVLFYISNLSSALIVIKELSNSIFCDALKIREIQQY